MLVQMCTQAFVDQLCCDQWFPRFTHSHLTPTCTTSAMFSWPRKPCFVISYSQHTQQTHRDKPSGVHSAHTSNNTRKGDQQKGLHPSNIALAALQPTIMATSPKFNMRNPSVKRVLQVCTEFAPCICTVYECCGVETCRCFAQEIKEMQADTSDEYVAEPLEVCCCIWLLIVVVEYGHLGTSQAHAPPSTYTHRRTFLNGTLLFVDPRAQTSRYKGANKFNRQQQYASSPPQTQGGIYHGRITLPPEYPFKPPSFIMLTPSGRFETNTKICLSISSHHPEHWQPSWSVRTALTALISFLPTPGNGALGSLVCEVPRDHTYIYTHHTSTTSHTGFEPCRSQRTRSRIIAQGASDGQQPCTHTAHSRTTPTSFE